MPSLDIATIKPSLQAHLVPLGAQSIIHAKTLPNPWIKSSFSKNLKFYAGHLNVRRGKVLITAVATLETKYPAQRENQQSYSLSSASSRDSDDGEEFEQVDDRERLRRMRISKANRGNTPWNKGRKHSPETLQKIRERTKIAMQDPKIKMKLANLGHAQNKETRMKIGEGVRMRWARRKERRKVQETCHYEWQNLLAEAARKGYTDQEELQWNSYKILDQQNQLEWLESVEQRKAAKGTKSNRRAPKSPEQRKKIAEAIAAKWADPSYRERVCSGLAKFHGIPAGGAERRRRRPSGGNTEPRKKSPAKKSAKDSDTEKQSQVQVVKVRKRKTPVYKDPLANSKLEMIKSIRAKRVAEESKKMDAVERARLLISEAEKAAKVLEIAARKSPVARASLLESKKLIAEATQLIESIEMRQIASDEEGAYPYLLSPHQLNSLDIESETEDTNDHEQPGEVNGTHTFPFNGESLHLNLRPSDLSTFNIEGGTTNHSVADKQPNTSQDGRKDIKRGMIPQPNGTRVYPPPESNGVLSHIETHPIPNGSQVDHGIEEKAESLESGNVTKKWVRGRLVEITEAA